MPWNKNLHKTKTSYFGKALQRCFIKKTFYFANLNIPHFFCILSRLRNLMEQKFALNKKIIFWRGLSKLFYAKMPNCTFLFCKLEFTLISWHFAKAVRALRLHCTKKSIKAKSFRPGSTSTLLLCKMSKFQLLIFGPWPTGWDPCSLQGVSPNKTA